MSLQRIQSVPSLLVQAQRLPIAYTGAQARHTKTEALGSNRQRTDTSSRVPPHGMCERQVCRAARPAAPWKPNCTSQSLQILSDTSRTHFAGARASMTTRSRSASPPPLISVSATLRINSSSPSGGGASISPSLIPAKAAAIRFATRSAARRAGSCCTCA